MKNIFVFIIIASALASCNDETSSNTPARNYDSITIEADDTSNMSLQTDTITNKENTENKNKPAGKKPGKKSRATRA